MVKCRYCGRTDIKAAGMTNHLKTCYVKTRLSCPNCGKRFRNEMEINFHMCLGGL